jgi:aminopeptidase N
MSLVPFFVAGCAAGQSQPSPTATAAAIVAATLPPTATPQPTATFTIEPSATPKPTLTPTATPPPTASPTTTAQVDDLTSTLPAPTIFDVEWGDHSGFAAGLITAEQSALELLPAASEYHIDLAIDDSLTTLTGRQEVRYTNTEDGPLSEIYFRLFPNLASGETKISNLTVNSEPVSPDFELQNSAMRLPLATPLPPDEQAVIAMDFNIRVPSSEGGNYGTFAYLDGVLALAHFYPMIAVFDDEGWNVEIAPPIGDVVYGDSSFYRVRVTAPASVTLAASGIELDRAEADGRQTVTFAAGPTRDFYIAASERFTALSQTVDETTITSYAPAEFSAGNQAVLEYAARSLEIFNEKIGPYPFTEFDLVSTTTFALGVEYPGIVAILIDLYQTNGNRPAVLAESVVAHEAAHQWFYSTVGNDQIDEPWVDEALAQYATLLYFGSAQGETAKTGFRGSLERRWARVDGQNIPIGLPVRDYTPQEYSAIVYGRGPLFIETLEAEMGADTFARFLQDYYRQQKWGIGTGQNFKELAEQHCDCDLTPLFEEWVYPKNGGG